MKNIKLESFYRNNNFKCSLSSVVNSPKEVYSSHIVEEISRCNIKPSPSKINQILSPKIYRHISNPWLNVCVIFYQETENTFECPDLWIIEPGSNVFNVETRSLDHRGEWENVLVFIFIYLFISDTYPYRTFPNSTG